MYVTGGTGEGGNSLPDKVLAKKKRGQKKAPKFMPLNQLAAKVALYDCGCGKFCLAKSGPGEDPTIDASVSVLQTYIQSWRIMTKRQHRRDFQDLVDGCTTGFSLGGERQGQLVLKFSSTHRHKVCAKAFAHAHLRGHTYYDEVFIFFLQLLRC